MRSRSSSLEEVVNHKHTSSRKAGVRRDGRRDAKEALPSKQKNGERDLTWDDLLFLLSMLEGELQARDEVIAVLRAEKLDPALLEAKYGFLTPGAMRALQRDSINERNEDVYQKPITELERVVQSHSECYRRMLDQLLLVERSHRNTLDTLVHEKQKHTHSSQRNRELTCRLERERDRLKHLVGQEKIHQERKEEENNRRLSRLTDELTKLRSFTLLVVDEHQQLSKQLKTQFSRAQELQKHQEELKTQTSRAQNLHELSDLIKTSTSTEQELQRHPEELKITSHDQEHQELSDVFKTTTSTDEKLQKLSEELKVTTLRGQEKQEYPDLKTQTNTDQKLQEPSEHLQTRTSQAQEQLKLSEALKSQTSTLQELQEFSPTQTSKAQKVLKHSEHLKIQISQEQELHEQLEHHKTQSYKDQKLKEHLEILKTINQELPDNTDQTGKSLNIPQNLQQLEAQKLQEHSEQMQAQLEYLRTQRREEKERAEQLERVAQEQMMKLQSMSDSLASTETLNRELQMKLAQLQKENQALRRAQEELRDQGMEVEARDEPSMRMEECRGLLRRLEEQVCCSQSLRDQLEMLKKSLLEMERLEQVFGSTREEAKSLQIALDRERGSVKHLNNQLEAMRSRLQELEELETGLERREKGIKEDLSKMKRLTVMLVEDRKGTSEKMKEMEEKTMISLKKQQEQQEKMNTLTEKLLEESKKNLQSKGQLEEKVCAMTREKDEIRARLRAEEEKSSDLQDKLCMMRKRLQSLEGLERESMRSKGKADECKNPGSFCCPPQEDNRVKDLTQELELLRRKLTEQKILGGEVLKKEDDIEALEKKLINEQARTKALMEELEASRNEVSKYKLSKKEQINEELATQKLSEKEMKQEQLINKLSEKEECIMNLRQISESSEFVFKEKLSEEFKLKEKLHLISQESMAKAQLSAVQRKLGLMEIRNRDLVREMEVLTRELERYRRVSRSLRPGMNGRRLSDLQINDWRLSDLQLSSKEVQTEPPLESNPNQSDVICSETPPLKDNMDTTDLIFSVEPLQIIIKPDQNHNTALLDITRHTQQQQNSPSCGSNNPLNTSFENTPKSQNSTLCTTTKNLNQPQNSPTHTSLKLEDSSTSFTTLKHQPQNARPSSRSENTPSNSNLKPQTDSEQSQSSPRTQIQSEITSLVSESPGSFRSTAVIPTSGAALKQRIRILQNQISPPTKPSSSSGASLDPLSISQCSQLPDRALSPVQIVSISTSPTDSADLSGTHKIFCLSPETQNGWSQNLINTEENQIHIRLGKPCILPLFGKVRAAGVCAPQRTPAMGNSPSVMRGNNMNNNNKHSSSILVKPSAGHIAGQFRCSGPTRIPKPRGSNPPGKPSAH